MELLRSFRPTEIEQEESEGCLYCQSPLDEEGVCPQCARIQLSRVTGHGTLNFAPIYAEEIYKEYNVKDPSYKKINHYRYLFTCIHRSWHLGALYTEYFFIASLSAFCATNLVVIPFVFFAYNTYCL